MNCSQTGNRVDSKECGHSKCLDIYLKELNVRIFSRGCVDFDYYGGIVAERAMVLGLLGSNRPAEIWQP